MNISITQEERKLLLIVLLHPNVKEAISAPETPKLVRLTYKSVLEKVKQAETKLWTPAQGRP